MLNPKYLNQVLSSGQHQLFCLQGQFGDIPESAVTSTLGRLNRIKLRGVYAYDPRTQKEGLHARIYTGVIGEYKYAIRCPKGSDRSPDHLNDINNLFVLEALLDSRKIPEDKNPFVRLIGLTVVEQKICSVMPYYPQDLFGYIADNMNDSELMLSAAGFAFEQFKQIQEFLLHLGVVHRDLKPENLLVRTETDARGRSILTKIRVCDLGSLVWVGRRDKAEKNPFIRLDAYGTPAYRPLASSISLLLLLLKHGVYSDPDIFVDVLHDDGWSLGLIVYAMLYTKVFMPRESGNRRDVDPIATHSIFLKHHLLMSVEDAKTIEYREILRRAPENALAFDARLIAGQACTLSKQQYDLFKINDELAAKSK
jgi:serine/threonine protein kinase